VCISRIGKVRQEFTAHSESTPGILVFLAYIPKNVNLKVNLCPYLSQLLTKIQNRDSQIRFPVDKMDRIARKG
jgi:hypothetical protein